MQMRDFGGMQRPCCTERTNLCGCKIHRNRIPKHIGAKKVCGSTFFCSLHREPPCPEAPSCGSVFCPGLFMSRLLNKIIHKLFFVSARELWMALALILGISICGLGLVTWKATENIQNGSHKYFEEIAGGLSSSIRLGMRSTWHAMERLGKEHIYDDMRHDLEAEAMTRELNLNTLYVLGPDGRGHDHQHEQACDFSQVKGVRRALQGEFSVFNCTTLHTLEEGRIPKNQLAFAVPLKKNREIIGAVVADATDSWGQNISDVRLLSGSISFVLFDSSGTILFHSRDFASVHPMNRINVSVQSLLQAEEQRPILDQINALKERPLQKTISFQYSVNDVQRDSVLIPLQCSGLYLYVMSLGEFGTSEFFFLNRTVFLTAVAVILLLGIICAILGFFYRYCRSLALEDSVTGGMSSVRFEYELNQRLRTSTPGQYTFFSININKFKIFNDFFGRAQGDRLLKTFYANIERALPAGATCLCRSGTDTFDLLCDRLHLDTVLDCLDGAAASTARSLPASGGHTAYAFSVRVGACILLDPQADYILLKDRVGMAMDRADRHFGNHIVYALYDKEDLMRARREKSIENCMQQSLAAGDFYILLQPKVELSTGRICGAEALVRWKHPQLGNIYPDEFVPILERNGFIQKVDAWVFTTVCGLMQKWHAQGKPWLPISINLSRVDLAHGHLLQDLIAIADAHGIPHHFLDLEITETLFCQEPTFIQNAIDAIRAAGFQCSMDDFGTGYSSLSLLPTLRVDTLKIDRSFLLSQNLDNPRERVVIRMIVDLGRELDLKVLAEGVETEAHRAFLEQCTCALAQGYLFSRPVPIEDFERLAFETGLCRPKASASENA